MSGIERLARIALNAADPERLAAFYVDVLGFEREGASMKLGGVRVDLRQGKGLYPADVAGWSPLFQHFAIVVSDMNEAMHALDASDAWSPISTAGAEHLPANTGSVTAFKFRDPEGHPLELLAFPDATPTDTNLFVRIDHSAISVADVERSIAFYAGLGLRVAARSLNSGLEQERLDALVGATVDVIALMPAAQPKPHVELLGYRGHYDRTATPIPIDHTAATRLVFAVANGDVLASVADRHPARVVARTGSSVLLHDPDGHLLQFDA